MKKQNTIKTTKKLIETNLILEDINWVEALKVNDKNVDTSLGNFLQIINSLLEKHAPQIIQKRVKKTIIKNISKKIKTI